LTIQNLVLNVCIAWLPATQNQATLQNHIRQFDNN